MQINYLMNLLNLILWYVAWRFNTQRMAGEDILPFANTVRAVAAIIHHWYDKHLLILGGLSRDKKTSGL
jgi:hypothetical protein